MVTELVISHFKNPHHFFGTSFQTCSIINIKHSNILCLFRRLAPQEVPCFQSNGWVDWWKDWRLKQPNMGDNMEITHILGIYSDNHGIMLHMNGEGMNLICYTIQIYLVIELHHDFLPLAICSGIRIFFVVSFAFISSEFRQTFRRVLCGKTFCHKILPQILSSEFR